MTTQPIKLLATNFLQIYMAGKLHKIPPVKKPQVAAVFGPRRHRLEAGALQGLLPWKK
jgi:hypothetical protein